MEDRDSITWKQFQKQTKHGVADDTKHKYKLGLRNCKDKKSKIIEAEKSLPYKIDNPLGSDDSAPGLLKTLLKERNVAISDKRYKQCIERYGNVLNFLGELGRRCVGVFGVRYAEPRDIMVDEDAQGSLDTLVFVGVKKPNKNTKGYWVIEEID